MKLCSKSMLLLLVAGLSCAGQDYHKLAFEGGGGLTLPVGSSKSQLNMGWNLLLGAGYNFTPHIAGLLEFQFDQMKYSQAGLVSLDQPGGYVRYFSFTLNPRYDFRTKGRLGGYVTGGYGLYGRRVAYTDPSQIQQVCDPYYGYCENTSAPVIAAFSSYRGGVNVGGGFTYSPGRSGMKFFTDVRYNRIMSHTYDEFMTLTIGLKY